MQKYVYTAHTVLVPSSVSHAHIRAHTTHPAIYATDVISTRAPSHRKHTTGRAVQGVLFATTRKGTKSSYAKSVRTRRRCTAMRAM